MTHCFTYRLVCLLVGKFTSEINKWTHSEREITNRGNTGTYAGRCDCIRFGFHCSPLIRNSLPSAVQLFHYFCT